MLLECNYSGPRAQSRRLPFPPCAPRGLLARRVPRWAGGWGSARARSQCRAVVLSRMVV